MTKTGFLKQLRKKISKLPPEERQRVLEYYGELIEDEIESGSSEEEAVSRRGSAEEIARRTIAQYREACQEGEYVRGRRRHGFGARLTIALVSFPIWLPVYISVWAVLISLAASAVALLLCGILGVFPFGALITTHPAVGWVQVGVCLSGAGIGGLLAAAGWMLCRWWVRFSGWLLRGIRWSFRKGGEAA